MSWYTHMDKFSGIVTDGYPVYKRFDLRNASDGAGRTSCEHENIPPMNNAAERALRDVMV